MPPQLEPWDLVVDHYADRAYFFAREIAEAETAEDYTQAVRAMWILERATNAEIHDPDPIDAEVGPHEPNWLDRLA